MGFEESNHYTIDRDGVHVELTRYAPGPSGLCNVGVTWGGSVSVLVSSHSGYEQTEIDRVAEQIADSHLAIARREAALAVEVARVAELEKRIETMTVRAAHDVGRIEVLDMKIDEVLGLRAPHTRGEVAARERDGKVWLGRVEDDWQSHFAFWFADWSDLRRTFPELAPCGAGVDARGGPFVRMRAVPIRPPAPRPDTDAIRALARARSEAT